ncbi:hypothetical protein AAG570_002133 [Ranatra chinensis]|uniref:PH domain-containing protein n=1 Tax=Ranatra chinensis TaxID=642074 RepID=A0ABD0Y6N1_9HEMI
MRSPLRGHLEGKCSELSRRELCVAPPTIWIYRERDGWQLCAGGGRYEGGVSAIKPVVVCAPPQPRLSNAKVSICGRYISTGIRVSHKQILSPHPRKGDSFRSVHIVSFGMHVCSHFRRVCWSLRPNKYPSSAVLKTEEMADTNTVIEGTVKFRDGKKWKSRWCVMRKLSPVAVLEGFQYIRSQKSDELRIPISVVSCKVLTELYCDSPIVAPIQAPKHVREDQ